MTCDECARTVYRATFASDRKLLCPPCARTLRGPVEIRFVRPEAVAPPVLAVPVIVGGRVDAATGEMRVETVAVGVGRVVAGGRACAS